MCALFGTEQHRRHMRYNLAHTDQVAAVVRIRVSPETEAFPDQSPRCNQHASAET